MPPKRQLPIDRAYLAMYFDSATLSRGESYCLEHRVFAETLQFRMPSINAYVQGSKKRPYFVQIEFAKRKDTWTISRCSCSCPVYFDCKHAVATLLTAAKIFGFDGEQEANAYSLYKEEKLLTAKTSSWLQDLELAMLSSTAPKVTQDNGSDLVYVLQPPESEPDEFAPAIYQLRDSRKGITFKELAIGDVIYAKRSYGNADDTIIASMLNSYFSDYFGRPTDPEADLIRKIFVNMIITGRCYFRSTNEEALKLGPSLLAKVSWSLLPSGRQKPNLISDDSVFTSLSPLPWYVNTERAESGPLELPLPAKALKILLDAPEVEQKEAAAIRIVLERILPENTTALPIDDFERKVIDKDPIKKLTLQSKTVTHADDALIRRGLSLGQKAPFVAATFEYGVPGIDLESNKKEISTVEGNSITVINRNLEMERLAIRQLQQSDLEAIPNWFRPKDKIPFVPLRAAHEKTISPSTWFKFLKSDLPKLQGLGWIVEIDPSFTVESVEAGSEWSSHVEDETGWWFSLEIGIEIDGQITPLMPILIEALKKAPFVFGPEDLHYLDVDGKFYAPLEDGRFVALPFERVKVFLSVILDLFDHDAESKEISINPWQAAELASLGITFEAKSRLSELAQRIKKFKGISAIDAPEGFQATLREYQKEGIGWLNFIREFEAGGILADDMGLGKTVQTLCHILIEKLEGRLDYPALIVCPTSVLPNWISEARKFTPSLKVLALHGSDRRNNFNDVYEQDIVVTTYPLLHRDKSLLLKRNWHVVVLDEAQFIRNPDTLAAKVAFQLQANYRLCLTGTPVENHLGDLWSQFHFLVPGYLGDQKNFGTHFRQPIEKHGDLSRLRILSQRVRPFLLRRTKTEVAKELPEKTIMIESVHLDGPQRDLYETVRLSMHKKVREEIEKKGFKRSQLAILEAILRLRQVCCDPRLIGTKFNHKAKESGKLSRLIEMLVQLIEEGRKILIFSQFTSMLDIIAAELQSLKIEFVQIRGDTKDRAEPVRKFQAEEVPIFLLSLKAGGTGLNLTAADTVIHYDPWWNPAVENQATDRAHRIGQTKPVFVYKMIASGTIEERMLHLQEKKKALAEGVFDEKKAASINITEEELDFLFRPLNDDPTVQESSGQYTTTKSKKLELVDLPLNDDGKAPDETPKPDSEDEIKDPFIEALLKQGLSIEEILSGDYMKKRPKK